MSYIKTQKKDKKQLLMTLARIIAGLIIVILLMIFAVGPGGTVALADNSVSEDMVTSPEDEEDQAPDEEEPEKETEEEDVKEKEKEERKTEEKKDTTKPTLNAAVNNGRLSIETSDDSGVKAVYVNDFEFTDLKDGKISIRMQQFDTGYENFYIRAKDNAGNMSDTYKVRNPYYKAKDESGKEVKVYPDSAEPTKPAEATAAVTDHVKTDESGKALADLFGSVLSSGIAKSSDSKTDEKTETPAEADDKESDAEPETIAGKGREFYTIEAKSGKVFYLIIDRTGEEEKVHFLTDITENDLLNVTEDGVTTLPQNAASKESDDLIIESALPNNNIRIDEESIFSKTEEPTLSEDNVSSGDVEGEKEKKHNPWIPRIIIFVIIGAAGFSIHTLNKKVKERDGDYLEEEDPDDDDDPEDDDIDDFDTEPEVTEDNYK